MSLLHFQKLVGDGSPSVSPGSLGSSTEQLAVMILPGFLGMGSNWRRFAKQLLNFWPESVVYLVDLRNHGESFHSSQMDYSLMAGDVYDLIKAEDLKNILLIGHSMGGKVAIKMLAQPIELRRRIVRSVIVDMGVSERDVEESKRLVRFLSEISLDDYSSRSEITDLLEKKFGSRLLAGFLSMNLTFVENQLRWQANIKSLNQNIDFLGKKVDLNGGISIPTKFIFGKNSDYYSEQEGMIIGRYFSRGTVILIDGGHWLHFDNLDGLLQEIANPES